MSAASHGGDLKTHIMYEANLSHRQLERHLTFLEQRGLIRQVVDEDACVRFYATEKGLGFLKEYSSLSGSLSL